MKVQLNKNQGKLIAQLIDDWHTHNLIDEKTKGQLSDTLEVKSFNWKKLAGYSFLISIICIVISISSVFADSFLLKFIEQLFKASDLAFSIFFAFAALGFYAWAYKVRLKNPHKIFSNEFVIMLAVLSTATAITFLGNALDNGNGHFSILFLLGTIIYAIIGVSFPSNLVWVFSLLSLGAWFGTETGYVSEWGAYYLGMNYPLRFVIFGLVLASLSYLFNYSKLLKPLKKDTYTIGLSYFFISLWILSISGNTPDIESWHQIKQIELLSWAVIFGISSIAAILIGLKNGDVLTRSFGITFLLINLYTRYFEYFWDLTHKSIFFIILALSFWVIGRNAERIWNVNLIDKMIRNQS